MPPPQNYSGRSIHRKHESPEWKKEVSRRMREMDAGKKVSLAELRRRMATS